MNRGQLFTFLGGFALVVGALLPWFTVTSSTLGLSNSVYGYSGPGLVTGGIGLILFIAAIFVTGTPGKLYSPVMTILAVLSSILIIYVIATFDYSFPVQGQNTAMIALDMGIYISLIGEVLAVTGGLLRVPQSPA